MHATYDFERDAFCFQARMNCVNTLIRATPLTANEAFVSVSVHRHKHLPYGHTGTSSKERKFLMKANMLIE